MFSMLEGKEKSKRVMQYAVGEIWLHWSRLLVKECGLNIEWQRTFYVNPRGKFWEKKKQPRAGRFKNGLNYPALG